MPPPIRARFSRVLLTGLAAAVLAAVAGCSRVDLSGQWPALDKPSSRGSTAWGAAWAECGAKTTEYLGYWYPPEEDWESGDHAMRCYLYLDKNVTGSLNGGGSKALPIS